MSDKLKDYRKFLEVPLDSLIKVFPIKQFKSGMYSIGYKLDIPYKDKKPGFKHSFTRQDLNGAKAIFDYLESGWLVGKNGQNEWKLPTKLRLEELQKKYKEDVKLIKQLHSELKKGFLRDLLQERDGVVECIKSFIEGRVDIVKKSEIVNKRAIKYLKENDTVEFQKKHAPKRRRK